MSSNHCFCRGEGQGYMIQCDGCDQWFHGKCVKISYAQSRNLSEWYCGFCKKWQMRYCKLEVRLLAMESQLKQAGDEILELKQQNNNSMLNKEDHERLIMENAKLLSQAEDKFERLLHTSKLNEEKFMQENAKLTKENTELKSDVSATLLRFNELSEKSDSAVFKNKCEELTVENEKLRSNLSSLALQFEEQSKESDSYLVLKNKCEELAVENERLHSNLSTLALQFKEISKESDSSVVLNNKCEELTVENEKLRSNLSSLTLQFEEQSKEKEELMDQVKRVNKRLRLSSKNNSQK